MCFILPSVCPNFPWYSIYALWRECPVNGRAANNSFSYEDSFRKGISTFLNFPVGDHSFTSSIIWSVWSILKPRGDWQIRKFKYLRTYPSCTFILNFSLNNLFSSGNAVIISSIENIISWDYKIGHCNIRKTLYVDSIINCDFLILNNCNHCIK